jgi:hypothetical protein
MKVRSHVFKENSDIFSVSQIGFLCGAPLRIIPNLHYLKPNSIRLPKHLSFVPVS